MIELVLSGGNPILWTDVSTNDYVPRLYIEYLNKSIDSLNIGGGFLNELLYNYFVNWDAIPALFIDTSGFCFLTLNS